MSKSKSKQDDKFALGLLLGFLAGSTGYFLFTTEQGKELKQKLKESWTDIKKEIPAAQDLKIGDLKVSQIVNIVLGVDTKKKRGAIVQKANRPKTRSSKKPTKFKGAN